MNKSVHILLLEDSDIDAELTTAWLDKLERPCVVMRADSREAFFRHLENHVFDIILADYSLPDFDGLTALEAARQRDKQIPFIFVSGVIGEDFAIEALKCGATDYVLKRNMARLPAAIERALQEAVERRERRAAEAALREADRRKDEFLAMLAHELRNPLAPLLTGIQVVRAHGDRPEIVNSTLEMMERQLRQMTRLVDDLLDVARITQNKLVLRREQFPVCDLIESVQESCAPLLKQSGHALVVHAPAEPLLIDGDKIRLTQLTANLIHNATKFSAGGQPIELSVYVQGDDLVVAVRDRGVGIPSEMLDSIFEMFTQVRASGRHSGGGLGIGLSLVRRIAELHGGSVQAFSAGEGEGSRFVARMPIVVGAVQAQPVAVEVRVPDGPKRSILIADDNRDAADSLATLLEIMGHQVQVAYDGDQAFKLAAVQQPDVLMLDIGMPGTDGLETARRIREQPWGREVLLIAITGWGRDEHKRQSQLAGFDHHMVKPVQLDNLLGILQPQ